MANKKSCRDKCRQNVVNVNDIELCDRIAIELEFPGLDQETMSTVMNSRHTGSANDVIRMRNSRPGASHTQSDTPPSSPVQTDARASRACCFCCLTVRNGTGRPDRAGTKSAEPVNEEPLTIEEIRGWAESFDKLMKKSSKCP
ncbi:uncharacterized protein LOC127851499 isoform X2 [Dreissena polymorpha]|uniref:uncharacterized protein LOC127851499 isoform X2 n=1 Tax=Dreissena polymorpha TaxID=45954 RepID=UPI002264E0C4|nr:uncharacterized protein LOC127851499 isoform X2 [Dreissena polymorpha]